MSFIDDIFTPVSDIISGALHSSIHFQPFSGADSFGKKNTANSESNIKIYMKGINYSLILISRTLIFLVITLFIYILIIAIASIA